ncbi:hexose transporter [Trypanosoma conorhini]|uniref:Hexose transporter n=1 Tax=Trypanosoma conorhini TaxID=83891 RepID=A0A3R7M7B9_9TRYP|nr:hexose transporter [Trypanosoma conorhini]RNF00797.1 hexose transporter [Trypanosoma conorhini]
MTEQNPQAVDNVQMEKQQGDDGQLPAGAAVSPHENPAEHTEVEKVPGFLSLQNMKVFQICLIGGMLNGYTIGLVPIYAFLYLTSTDCSLYKSEDACITVLNAECQWDVKASQCGWRYFTCGKAYPTDPLNPAVAEAACKADSRCSWVYADKECNNLRGYTPTENGIFASAMILGAMLGSMYCGKFVVVAGHNMTFTVGGLIAVVSSVMYHVSVHCNEFWVLCVGRLLIGLTISTVYVAGVMYLDQNAIRKHYHKLGVSLGLFTTFGILLAAVMGLAVGRSIDYKKDANLGGRMHAICAVSTLLSTCMTVSGIFLPVSKVQFKEFIKIKAKILNADEYSLLQMSGRLALGLVIAGSAQLTGINAVMNYAPTIMSRFGVESLLGNFLVMLWNFLSSFAPILLSNWFTVRQMFLFGSFASSISCLLLCGVPVYPGVAASTVRNGVAITGIVIFVLSFEIGLAGCFGVLTQDIFPPSFRPKGASFVMLVQFLFNLIINLCFPIAVERVSGGPSANQDKGQAVAFIFFGCVGLLCSIIELFFLHRWEDIHPEGSRAKKANPEMQQTLESAPEPQNNVTA